MIIIDNVLVSDEVVTEQFVCNLNACKGGCCEEGDAGAPLTDEELDEIIANYDVIETYLNAEGKQVLEKVGKYVYHKQFGWVTPTVNSGICAYGYKNEQGIIICGIEQAYNDGKIGFKKPISCHLYPIKISSSKMDAQVQYMNYEPRETLCASGCSLGTSLKVPVYTFLKEAIERKYGKDFYEALAESAKMV